MPKPLKRSLALQPLSRDHHHGLALCWNIRKGIKATIELSRIKDYVDWFYVNHLLPHFAIEESDLFPILGNEHQLIKRALTEHHRLKHLFKEERHLLKTFGLIKDELEQHIRFEERILFNEIQSVASADQLKALSDHYSVPSNIVAWKDEFWK
jgi:hypothetical protein